MTMHQMDLAFARLVLLGQMYAVWNEQNKEVLFVPVATYHGQYGDPLTLEECADHLAWPGDWEKEVGNVQDISN